LLPPIVWKLRYALNEILLVGLTEREPVDPSQLAKLIVPVRLLRLWKDHKQPVNLLTRTTPPRAYVTGRNYSPRSEQSFSD
jgi:hypothetical protein